MSDPIPPAFRYPEDSRPVEVFVVNHPLRDRYWLHILLLILTIFTTLVVGARLENNFLQGRPAFTLDDDPITLFPVTWIAHQPSRLLLGLPFSVTLMGILLAHEMGHYFYCVRYGVQATLPFFIPAPTLIGTLGAFIRIRGPIRSREALFDIGIAGPIAGFVVAIFVLFFSMLASKPATMPQGDVFGYPLIFRFMNWLINGGSSVASFPLSRLQLHPTAIAAWVGMFATALNLLPGGQLDGGHLVYSVAPWLHRYMSIITIGVLLGMSTLWMGWLVWAILLGVTGVQHPQVPLYPALTRGRRMLAVLGIAMLILTFVPKPFPGAEIPLPHWR